MKSLYIWTQCNSNSHQKKLFNGFDISHVENIKVKHFQIPLIDVRKEHIKHNGIQNEPNVNFENVVKF